MANKRPPTSELRDRLRDVHKSGTQWFIKIVDNQSVLLFLKGLWQIKAGKIVIFYFFAPLMFENSAQIKVFSPF